MQKQKKYTDIHLEDEDGVSNYSADASDYWTYPDTFKFDNQILVGTVYKAGGWHRKEIIKKEPTIADLKRYKKLLILWQNETNLK